MRPYITVCIATYQFGPFLERCIKSLVSQTLQPAKIIICDDCSQDESWKILQSWHNNHPKLIAIHRPPHRIGANEIGSFMCSFMNKAGGDFIVTIDGDDCWHKKKLEREYAAILDSPGAEFAFSDVALTDSKDDEIGYWRKHKETPSEGDIFLNVLGRRYFEGTNSIFRNELVSWRVHSEEGYVDRNLANFWDWDRKIRFANRYKGAHSGETLVYYRQHPGGISKTFGGANLFTAMIEVYEKHLPTLVSRSLCDQLFVRISFETLAAKQRKQLKITGHQSYSYPIVHQRIASLLQMLPPEEQLALKNTFSAELLELQEQTNKSQEQK